MGKATKSDDDAGSDEAPKKALKPARAATVLKPVIIGGVVLALAQAVLPKVL